MDAAVGTDVVVIGGGQAGLAVGYHLRRAGAEFVVLDDRPGPGGAWRDGWDSLRLFSPAPYSSLPGWPMPVQPGEPFPTGDHVREYLARYARRYDLPVHPGVAVDAVTAASDARRFAVHSGDSTWRCRAVVSATGTWGRPRWPHLPGADSFAGVQLHAASYRRPDPFAGGRVLVVGGGNSAAQIVAEVSRVADTTWCTRRPPRFMPDEVDGRVLFDLASARIRTAAAGGTVRDVGGLGDIVMVPSVQAARGRGVMVARPMFAALTPTGARWDDGTTRELDAVIWCTGFEPDLDHLAPLVPAGHRPATEGTRCIRYPGLHLVGYGDWTGPASATLVGAGRTARRCVAEIVADLT